MSKKKSTSAALKYLHRRFFAGRPKRSAELEEARASAEVARKVYELRTLQREPSIARLLRSAARNVSGIVYEMRWGRLSFVVRVVAPACQSHAFGMRRG